MRRPLPWLLLALLLALPRVAQAQGPAQQEAVEAEDGAIDDGAGYEPDQRGVEDGSFDSTESGEGQSTRGGDRYEPDQRGATVEGTEQQPQPAPAQAGGERVDTETLSAAEEGYGRGGVGLEFYLWLGAGVTGLDAIEGADLLLPTQSSSIGGSFGLTVGARLGPVTIGPRFSLTLEPSSVLGAIGLDAIVALMSGSITPTVRAALSYAFAIPTAELLPSQNGAGGVLVELGVGLRGELGGGFFLGGELSAGYLALFRDAVPACTAPCTDGASFDLRRPGSAQGLSGRLHLFGGWSF